LRGSDGAIDCEMGFPEGPGAPGPSTCNERAERRDPKNDTSVTLVWVSREFP